MTLEGEKRSPELLRMQRGSSSRLLWRPSRTVRIAETSGTGRSPGSSCGLCGSGRFDRKRTWPNDHAFNARLLGGYGDSHLVVGRKNLRNRPGMGVDSQPAGRGAHPGHAGRLVADRVPVRGISGRGTGGAGARAAWMGAADRYWFLDSSAVKDPVLSVK